MLATVTSRAVQDIVPSLTNGEMDVYTVVDEYRHSILLQSVGPGISLFGLGHTLSQISFVFRATSINCLISRRSL